MPLFEQLPVLIVAWGVLAIGAVYPWGYVPLAVAAIVSGAYELWTGRRLLRRGPGLRIAVALGVLAATVAFQLLPLPVAIVEAVSPAAQMLLPVYAVGYTGAAVHPLSIRPEATWLALALVIAFGTFLPGLVVRFMRRGTRGDVAAIVWLGVVVSLVAIVQRASGTQYVYGLWQPTGQTTPYGPFINRNHFAGWTLMALPLAIGVAMSRIRAPKPPITWSRRIAWWTSAEAGQAVLSAFAALVMATALVLSTSRSGVIALFVTVMLLAFATSVQASRGRRLATLAYLAVLIVVAVGWGTTRDLTARFETAADDFKGRVEIWQDTTGIVADAPWTGTGLNTFAAAMLFYQKANRDVQYTAAHNDFLQLAAEGGALLCVPAAIFIGTVITSAARAVRQFGFTGVRAGAVAGLIAIALQELGEFSLQIPGNVALWCVLVALAVSPRLARSHRLQEP